MNIAEFFINVAIKGNGAVVGALGGMQSSLKSTADMSFAAKAGIVGMAVALEELTRASVNRAVDLNQFAIATGLSTEKLQAWGNMAKLNNVTFEEMGGTLKGLQNTISNRLMGKGQPEGWFALGLSEETDPFEIMQKVQKSIRNISNVGVARSLANSIGISDKMFVMLREGRKDIDGLSKSMRLNGDEQKKLMGLSDAWNQFWLTLEGQTNKTAAHFSGPLVEIVNTMKHAFMEIGDLLGMLEKSLSRAQDIVPLFKSIAVGVGLLLAPFFPLTAAVVALVVALDSLWKFQHGEASPVGDVVKALGEDFSLAKKSLLTGTNAFAPDQSPEAQAKRKASFAEMVASGAIPKGSQKPNFNEGDKNVNITNYIDGATDPKEFGKKLDKQLTDATYQDPSLSWQN